MSTMTLDAKIQDLITSFTEFIGDVNTNEKNIESLTEENVELKEMLQSCSEEISKQSEELNQCKQEVRDLLERNSGLNAQRRSFTEEISKDMVSQSQVVKLKYEVLFIFYVYTVFNQWLIVYGLFRWIF